MKRHLLVIGSIYLLLITLETSLSLATEKRPEWIDGSSLFYPEEDYLIGVGYGGTRDKAEEQAYTAVSKIFLAQITYQSKEWERYIQVERDGKREISRDVDIDQLTTVSTDKVLENVVISERWFDSASNVHYALASLNRRQVTSSLRERISSLDKRASEFIKIGNNSTDKLQRIRALKRGIDTLLLRDLYNADLRIVNPKGEGMEDKINIVEVSHTLEEILTKEFNIWLDISGEDSNHLSRYIIEGLNRIGLSVREDRDIEDIDIVIRGRLDIKDTGINDPPWKYLRWAVNLILVEQSTGKSIGSITKSGREGHLTKEEARNKVLQLLQREVVGEVGDKVAGFIFGKDLTKEDKIR